MSYKERNQDKLEEIRHQLKKLEKASKAQVNQLDE